MVDQVAVWRAGIKRVCITPPLPSEMAGYFHSRIATSVARDLYATVLAIAHDGQYAVVVGCDLGSVTDELCMPAFQQASREYGIPLANMTASATHTHTGPEIRRNGRFPVSEEYLRIASGLISEAVMGALRDTFDAVLCAGVTHAPGLAHNRLSRCADGSEIFGQQYRGSPVIGPAGPEDDTVQTLSIYDTDKRLRGVVVNYACHPDISGGGHATAIDADWPGEMTEYLMRVHGSDLACMVLQGTAGDINHVDSRAAVPRWQPGGRPTVARGVAGAALYAIETARPLTDPTLGCRKRDLEIPFYVRDRAILQLAESLKAKGAAATYFEQNLIAAVEGWTHDGEMDHMSVSCVRVGEVAIVILPGEIFTAWGLEIKRYSPAKQTFVVELANSPEGWAGYKPTSDQALRGARGVGAYGALPTLSQRHCPSAGQMLTEAAIAMLYELWPA